MSLGCEAVSADLAESLKSAREWAIENDGIVCISGSLFLVGDVKEIVEANMLVPLNGEERE